MTLVIIAPISTKAEVNVDVHIALPLPPPILFPAPPVMVVLPETYVYVAPDVDVDIFFYNGWWWRPWEGRWYRSRYHNTGWAHYKSVPSFYARVHPGWRNDYRDRRWKGHPWNHQRIPHQQVQGNWQSWEKNRHWEKQQTWGVQGLKPRTQSQQPPRTVQPQQSRPQLKGGNPAQSQSQEGGPQSRGGQPQHSQQQQGNHKKGK